MIGVAYVNVGPAPGCASHNICLASHQPCVGGELLGSHAGVLRRAWEVIVACGAMWSCRPRGPAAWAMHKNSTLSFGLIVNSFSHPPLPLWCGLLAGQLIGQGGMLATEILSTARATEVAGCMYIASLWLHVGWPAPRVVKDRQYVLLQHIWRRVWPPADPYSSWAM